MSSPRDTAAAAVVGPFATEETYLLRADDRRTQNRRGVLTFLAGNEVYGIEILSIREIIKPREITEVPRAPLFLLGIVTVRGLVMPVLDLRLRLRVPAAEPGPKARVLVVLHKGERYGLLVDAVRDVVRFGEAQIEPPPTSMSGAEGGFLAGIGRYEVQGEERLVILLSLDAVLDFEVRG